MLLGDLLARLEDEGLAAETLLSIGDLGLTARVMALAAERDLTPGELTVQSVGRFLTKAGDEDWLSLVGQMSRVDNPGAVFLRRVLKDAVPSR